MLSQSQRRKTWAEALSSAQSLVGCDCLVAVSPSPTVERLGNGFFFAFGTLRGLNLSCGFMCIPFAIGSLPSRAVFVTQEMRRFLHLLTGWRTRLVSHEGNGLQQTVEALVRHDLALRENAVRAASECRLSRLRRAAFPILVRCGVGPLGRAKRSGGFRLSAFRLEPRRPGASARAERGIRCPLSRRATGRHQPRSNRARTSGGDPPPPRTGPNPISRCR